MRGGVSALTRLLHLTPHWAGPTRCPRNTEHRSSYDGKSYILILVPIHNYDQRKKGGDQKVIKIDQKVIKNDQRAIKSDQDVIKKRSKGGQK